MTVPQRHELPHESSPSLPKENLIALMGINNLEPASLLHKTLPCSDISGFNAVTFFLLVGRCSCSPDQ